MDDFDLSLEGYTPDDRYQSRSAYRPVGAPTATATRTANLFGEEPYRPPVITDDDSVMSAVETSARPQPRQAPQQPPRQPQQSGPKPQPTVQRPNIQAADTRVDEPTAPLDSGKRRRRTEDSKKEQKPKGPNPVLAFLKSENMRIFVALTLAVTSIFMVISLVSHFISGAHDQSAAANMDLNEISKQPSIIDNFAGGIGAKIAKILLCDTLGLGSIVLIVYMWAISLHLLNLRKCKFWSTTFRCLLLSITISLVLGLVTYNYESEIFWGGNHGHYINEYLMSVSTWIGAVCVSLILVIAVCCVYLNELRILWKKCKAAAERHRLQEELRRQRQRELERIEEDEREKKAEKARDTSAEAANAPAEKNSVMDSLKSMAERFRPNKASVKDTESTADARANAAANPAASVPTAASTPNRPVRVASTSYNVNIDIDREDENMLVIDPDAKSTAQVITGRDETFSVVAPTIEEASQDDAVEETVVDNGLYDHRAELSRYNMPGTDLLEDRQSGPVIDMDEQQANKERIEKTLLEYKIPIVRIEATVGPTVTLYEIVPAEGIRISQIKRLEDDIALSLSALGIRIIAPIPGKGTVGIEVPNNDPKTVSIRSVLGSRKYRECKMALPMAMGATISNDIFIADLAKMPHLLVAGATGMGKSVGLNTIIASLLYKKHPSELKLVLIDPKMVEFSLYSKLERHFLAKLPNEEDAIITDMKKVIETLNSLCVEMENRYKLLRDANVRSLEEYNKKFTERRLNPLNGHKYLPYIVVIVDEFADLIMTQGKEIETPISRIAQKARAVGIHMILATQRPSTNVITGLIKANFPGRIAFRVIQMVDSRTILDCPGANQLIGKGDMLFSHNGSMERVQCAFISTEEVESITEFIDNQIGYEHAYHLPEYVPEEVEGGVMAGASTERDAIFDEAARFVVSRQMGSTSSLQRQFGIGYNRAGKLMDQMEAAGIVGQVNGSKPRAILVDMTALESILGQG